MEQEGFMMKALKAVGAVVFVIACAMATAGNVFMSWRLGSLVAEIAMK